MNEIAINLKSITKSFGRKKVLDSLSLQVPRGQTFALLGRNGAGKTTTINMLMGLLQPSSGSISVLGLDPKRDSLQIRRRVGFLAEDAAMFGWMQIEQIISFLEPFYPDWNREWAMQQIERFNLDPMTRIKHLSKGQTVQVGLILALSHQPELVILDDPTLGLDPIARKEFMRDVIEHLQGRGTTVFYTSHILDEIETIADSVAILDGGAIICQESTESLRERVKAVLIPKTAKEQISTFNGILDIKTKGKHILVVTESFKETREKLTEGGIQFEVMSLNLDEIFEAYVIGRRSFEHDQGPYLERVA